jgi:hypothetical protein
MGRASHKNELIQAAYCIDSLNRPAVWLAYCVQGEWTDLISKS